MARWTWPIEAAANGVRSKVRNRVSGGEPSSRSICAAITSNGTGGASRCKPRSASAISFGKMSPAIEAICPTFITAPFSSPRVRAMRPPFSSWASRRSASAASSDWKIDLMRVFA